MKFEILSDIHLELLQQKNIDSLVSHIKSIRECDILCLLGDIGYPYESSYKQFLNEMVDVYKNVIVIAGNHEYYGHRMDKVNIKIKLICKEINSSNTGGGLITFLNNESYEINNIVFIGSTLWSKIKNHYEISKLMNDYEYIKIKSVYKNINKTQTHKFNTYNCNELHNIAVEYINFECGVNSDKDVIVLTHHAPILDKEASPEDYRDAMSFEAYHSDQSNVIKNNKNIRVWCFGHTHQEYYKKIDGCIIASNPLDYHCAKIKGLRSDSPYFKISLVEY